MKPRNSSTAGFSLVEVALALGVVVFCMVTIMGLLAVGVNTSHSSSTQTTAANTLNAIAADIESTPNTVYPSYKGASSETSPIYQISLPSCSSPVPAASTPTKTPTPASAITSPATTIYIGDDGSYSSSVSSFASGVTPLYQVNIWVTSPGTNVNATPASSVQQETFVRLVISWPAETTLANAQGSLEQVLALNRTP
jgi:Tfp pilus assembly protein PilV